MRFREVYEAVLFEQNKEEAPTLLVDKFNYMANKAYNLYCNKKYAILEADQQADDDLQFLMSVVNSDLTAIDFSSVGNTGTINLVGNRVTTGSSLTVTEKGFEFQAPIDYRHLRRLKVTFKRIGTSGECETFPVTFSKSSRRMTTDMQGFVELNNNAYLKPSLDNIYHYFKNSQTSEQPVIEVFYGELSVDTLPIAIELDYIKNPAKLVLLESELDAPTDASQVLEFPDYVAYEIINSLVALVMENYEDQRLNTHIPINQSIRPGMPTK